MKRTFATFAAAAALTLGACGAPADDEAAATSENAAETTTVTQEVTEEATDSPTETDGSDDSADGVTEAAEGTAPSGDGTPPPPDGETPQEPEQPEQPDQSAEEFQNIMAEEMRNNGNIGDTFTIDGQPTELCVHDDGYGLNVVTAGANTSCEFAKNVMMATTGDTDPTQDNVRDSMPQTVKAGSPTTNRAYTMDCAADERNLITCVGGDNAVVYMY
ncbi:hypothetical protein [Corynebacterium casei]|uniref:Secreted protein n=1 Tax=Corynebacterium casei LMG S-19264 TaxID=1285583 RepID=A0ABN4CCX8_9CORY|nr:hypothetical protein [Corynebacterium casei]AHI20190.1 hypothetical protein CCASEI_08125 [Corynebacterium casei LMG S-19264]